MAEAYFADRLAAVGVDAHVHSAGLLTDGREASAHGVTVMGKRGFDLRAHRSRRMTAEMLDGADLIVGMERRHVREVAVLVPEAFGVAFTLPELARRLDAVGTRPEEVPVVDWIRRAGAGRRPADLLGDDAADEIADPYGRARRHYERTANEIEALVDNVVARLHP